MYHFWPTGAEIVENVTFGDHPVAAASKVATKARSAGSWNSRAFISRIGATCVSFLGKYKGRTANLNNNNIYKYI